MNILVTLNHNYLPHLTTLMRSVCRNNPDVDIDLYVIANDVALSDLQLCDKVHATIIPFDEKLLAGAPTTKRYPLSVYYRIFAPYLLPDSLERILYLDPDIIVKGDLSPLYQTQFGNSLFIASTNVGEFLRKFNEIRTDAPKGAVYVNSGVMLMNLALLRQVTSPNAVLAYIKSNSRKFTLPDQDVICGLYGDRITLVDRMKYNLNDRAIIHYDLSHFPPITNKWIEQNAVIIHYYGRNKPWKRNYKGMLKGFYDQYN